MPSSRHVQFNETVKLLAAAADGDEDEIVLLLGRGVDPNCRNADGLTPLHQVGMLCSYT